MLLTAMEDSSQLQHPAVHSLKRFKCAITFDATHAATFWPFGRPETTLWCPCQRISCNCTLRDLHVRGFGRQLSPIAIQPV